LATIRDVAKRANVAISTVSAVLNRSAPVSEETIARVELAIAEIGYMPHGGAQSLRSGRSRMIGLILPDITNPHFANVARVVESACLDAGYMAAVYSTSEDYDRERQILKMMRAQRAGEHDRGARGGVARREKRRGNHIAHAQHATGFIARCVAVCRQRDVENRMLAELFGERDEMHRVEEETQRRLIDGKRRFGKLIRHRADQILRG